MDKLEMKTKNIIEGNIERIGTMFPHCIVETKNSNGKVEKMVDFEMLKQELSNCIVEDTSERYMMTWPDKKQSILTANAPITKTLRPLVEKSVDFEKTKNIYIEGDNLDVLKVIRETYLNKIKFIYIDPPYNTGNDFIYEDDFAKDSRQYILSSNQLDEEGNRMVVKTESDGRFHTDWLNMMYTRLKVARDVLTNDGVIFISIDDNEQANLKKICDEIFGESNFVGELIHQRAKGGGQAKYIVKGHDYILIYAKEIENVELARKKVIQQKTIEINGELYIKNDDVVRKMFGKYDKSLGDRRCFYEELIQYKGEAKKKEIDEDLAKGKLFLEENADGMHVICRYEKVEDAKSKLYSIIKVLSEEGKKELEEIGVDAFSYPKPTEIIRQLVEAGTDKDSIVLDFFSGSATTAEAVMKQNSVDGGNRRFIMVQVPEKTNDKEFSTICDIGQARIKRSAERARKFGNNADIDCGFRVLKLDSSCMKDVYYNPADVTQDLLSKLEDNIKEDRTSEDLLFQVMLDMGVDLSSEIKKEIKSGKTVYNVNDGNLVCCFDNKLTNEVVTEIAKMQPLYAVFRDSSMANDSTNVNFEQIFETYSPTTKRKVL